MLFLLSGTVVVQGVHRKNCGATQMVFLQPRATSQ
jgi:hypothetical protein